MNHRGRRHGRRDQHQTAIGRFVRARLHRRLFLWFGATILSTVLATMLAAGAAAALLDHTGTLPWRREYVRAQGFIGNQLQRVWDDPVGRDTLARTMAQDMEAGLELKDGAGRTIAAYGHRCGPWAMSAPVYRSGAQIGVALVCPDRVFSGGLFRVALPLFAVASVLWAASGLISRRITRPLADLARVASEIGAGKLSSRVRLDWREHGEVGVVAEAVDDMAARIERQLADQRELLAAVSHELRTPLARIRLLTEIARGSVGPSEATLNDLDREVMEIDALVGDLLASSRLDFAALTLRRLDPVETAVRAVERAGLDPTVIEVVEGTPAFEGDATLLARALANLIENARTHAGGAERVRVRPAPGGLAFEVEDRGPGFAAEDEVRVFEPFYRGGRAAGMECGSLGLGLALCKRIAEAHGGRAYAESREGGGARVGIELGLSPRGGRQRDYS